jgi:hypothetical protein
MRLTLLTAILALTMTACGKPNQALPEQEKKNFEKIISQPAKPTVSSTDSSAPTSASTDTAPEANDSSNSDGAKGKKSPDHK